MENQHNEEFPIENSAANPIELVQTQEKAPEPEASQTEPNNDSTADPAPVLETETAPEAVEMASEVEVHPVVENSEAPENRSVDTNENPKAEAPLEARVDEGEPEAVESEDHAEHEELPDLGSLETEELIALAAKLLAEREIAGLRNPMESIQAVLTDRFDTDYRSQLEVFKAGGGNEIDFRAELPLKDEFRKVFQQYKNKRRDYYQLMESQLKKNLELKQGIIEELRTLAQRQDNVGSSFQEFRALQDRWKAIGPVPKADSDELWKTYHFHIDNFYDLVRLDRELRDLDFKHNLALKTELCQKAEALVEEEKLGEALSKLNTLHREWKEIGPVDREHREVLWQRFKAATHQMHVRREEAQRKSAEELEQRLVEQEERLMALEAFGWEGIEKHSGWQKATEEIGVLFEAFKKLGRPRHPKSEELWNRALTHYRGFLHTKNQFYKEVKSVQKENLKRKLEMVARAEALKDSEDWNHAARELRKLQDDWKQVGPVAARDADRTWKAFRSACNHFFDRLKQRHKAEEDKQDQQVQAKQSVLDKLKSAVEQPEALSLETVETLSAEFRNLGRGSQKERNVERDFDQWVRKAYVALNIDQEELERKHFQARVERMSSSGDVDALDREREHLRRKMDELQKDLRQLENNILFFSSGKKANPFLTQIEAEIAAKRTTLEEIKGQLRTLSKSV